MACALRGSIVAGTVPTGEARPKSSMVTCPRDCAKTLSATLRAIHRPVSFDRSSLTGRGTQASEVAPCDHPSCRAARARRQRTSRRRLHGGARTRPGRNLFRLGGNRRRRRDGELGKPSRRRSCFRPPLPSLTSLQQRTPPESLWNPTGKRQKIEPLAVAGRRSREGQGARQQAKADFMPAGYAGATFNAPRATVREKPPDR